MKRICFLLALFAFAATAAHATVTIELDAGYLRGQPNGGTPAAMPVGGLLLLISNTGESLFDSATAGHYVTGDDSIVAAFAMNDNGGGGTLPEDQTPLNGLPYGGTFVSGDELALRWFPGITYTQYEDGVLPTASEYYGTYSAGTSAPDGGNDWVVPADGTLAWDLDFFTSDDSGAEPPSAGYASSEIAAVPEPGSIALLTGAFGLGAMMLRRRK